MKNLSEKELEVLKVLVEGKNNKDISAELCISLGTVKAHVASIMRKLGVTNRTKVVYVAIKDNIIEI